jgi:hypothetical protein
MICMSSDNGGHSVTKKFIPLHYTSPNYTSLHLLTLHFLSFKRQPTTLHSTSLHLSTLHFLSFKLHPTTLHSTSLTCRHFTSSHLNFTQLHFTNLSLGLTPFKFPTAPFRLASHHHTSLSNVSSRCPVCEFLYKT